MTKPDTYRGLLAENIRLRAENTYLLPLVKASLWEIKNLLDKLSRSEPEGWEGSKRRAVLIKNLQKALLS